MPQFEIGTTLPEWWELVGGQEAIVQSKDWKGEWVGMVYKRKYPISGMPNYAGYVKWDKYGRHGSDLNLSLKRKKGEQDGREKGN